MRKRHSRGISEQPRAARASLSAVPFVPTLADDRKVSAIAWHRAGGFRDIAIKISQCVAALARGEKTTCSVVFVLPILVDQRPAETLTGFLREN